MVSSHVIPLSKHKVFVETTANFHDYLEWDAKHFKGSNVDHQREVALNYQLEDFQPVVDRLADNFGMIDLVNMDKATFLANHMYNFPTDADGSDGRRAIEQVIDGVPTPGPPSARNTVDPMMRYAQKLEESNKQDIIPGIPFDFLNLKRNGVYKYSDFKTSTLNYVAAPNYELGFTLKTSKNAAYITLFGVLLFQVPELLNDFVFNNKVQKYKGLITIDQIRIIQNSIKTSVDVILKNGFSSELFRKISFGMFLLVSNFSNGLLNDITIPKDVKDAYLNNMKDDSVDILKQKNKNVWYKIFKVIGLFLVYFNTKVKIRFKFSGNENEIFLGNSKNKYIPLLYNREIRMGLNSGNKFSFKVQFLTKTLSIRNKSISYLDLVMFYDYKNGDNYVPAERASHFHKFKYLKDVLEQHVTLQHKKKSLIEFIESKN
jgi:hypothetical protein